MNKIYTWYVCKGCHKEVILLTDEVQRTIQTGRYLACPHCGCRKLIEGSETDNLQDCMKERKYKRNVRGAIEQIT